VVRIPAAKRSDEDYERKFAVFGASQNDGV
jgi:hypothetical protein